MRPDYTHLKILRIIINFFVLFSYEFRSFIKITFVCLSDLRSISDAIIDALSSIPIFYPSNIVFGCQFLPLMPHWFVYWIKGPTTISFIININHYKIRILARHPVRYFINITFICCGLWDQQVMHTRVFLIVYSVYLVYQIFTFSCLVGLSLFKRFHLLIGIYVNKWHMKWYAQFSFSITLYLVVEFCINMMCVWLTNLESPSDTFNGAPLLHSTFIL